MGRCVKHLSFFEKTIKESSILTDITDKKVVYCMDFRSWKGKVEIMALESIGATGNNRNYVDAVKTVSKTPQAQLKAAEEPVKKTAAPAPATVSAAASAEAKGTEAQGQKEEEIISSKIKDAVDKVNQKIIPSKTRCEFSYHEDTNRISIKVIDQATEETIKEIPAEETLDMLSKIWELAGLLVDERR